MKRTTQLFHGRVKVSGRTDTRPLSKKGEKEEKKNALANAASSNQAVRRVRRPRDKKRDPEGLRVCSQMMSTIASL